MTAMTREVREAMERRRKHLDAFHSERWNESPYAFEPHLWTPSRPPKWDMGLMVGDAYTLADYALATTEPGKRVVSVELLERAIVAAQHVRDISHPFQMSKEASELVADLRAAIAEQGSETPGTTFA